MFQLANEQRPLPLWEEVAHLDLGTDTGMAFAPPKAPLLRAILENLAVCL